jgi:hypothetical protein
MEEFQQIEGSIWMNETRQPQGIRMMLFDLHHEDDSKDRRRRFVVVFIKLQASCCHFA